MTTPRVRALMVGIDEYPLLDPDRALRGAVADIEAMTEVLRSRIPEIDLRTLIDEEATRESVLASLEKLSEDAEVDDEVIFYWSGHGSQVRDLSRDDEDGWDETLVPHDSGRGGEENRDLIDDEIYAWIERLSQKTSRITLIIDSCHSGTVARTGVRGVPRDPRPRRAESNNTATEVQEAPRGASGWLPLSDGYLLLAACRDDQEAVELPIGGQYRGAFSWVLVEELAKALPQAQWREIFKIVEARVAVALFGAQVPQMEGARDRFLPEVGGSK